MSPAAAHRSRLPGHGALRWWPNAAAGHHPSIQPIEEIDRD